MRHIPLEVVLCLGVAMGVMLFGGLVYIILRCRKDREEKKRLLEAMQFLPSPPPKPIPYLTLV